MDIESYFVVTVDIISLNFDVMVPLIKSFILFEDMLNNIAYEM